MDKCEQKQEEAKIQNSLSCSNNVAAEVISSNSNIEGKYREMSEEEEDIIYRMHKLVGDRWTLIAGRIPGRKAEEIQRFWVMRNSVTSVEHNQNKQY